MSRVTKKEYTELKKRAMLAKQRLKMGYWQTMTDEKLRALNEIGLNTCNIQLVKDLQHAKVKRDENRALNFNAAQADENFYTKVCEILDSDENVTNPIGQLVDKDAYEKLDEDNKQRYILELAKKFRDMRERYYREKLGKSC